MAAPAGYELAPGRQHYLRWDKALRDTNEDNQRMKPLTDRYQRENDDLKHELQIKQDKIDRLQDKGRGSPSHSSPKKLPHRSAVPFKTGPAPASPGSNEYRDDKRPPFQILGDPSRINAWQTQWTYRRNEDWDPLNNDGIYWDDFKQDDRAHLAVYSLHTLAKSTSKRRPLDQGQSVRGHVWKLTVVETPKTAHTKDKTPFAQRRDRQVLEPIRPNKQSPREYGPHLPRWSNEEPRPQIDSCSPIPNSTPVSDSTREAKRGTKRQFSVTGFEEAFESQNPQRKAICVNCWVNHLLCDFHGQCKKCQALGIRCVRKLCEDSVLCRSRRCPRLHPGQFDSNDPNFIAEDGRLPKANTYHARPQTHFPPVKMENTVESNGPRQLPMSGRRGGDYYCPAELPGARSSSLDFSNVSRSFGLPRG